MLMSVTSAVGGSIEGLNNHGSDIFWLQKHFRVIGRSVLPVEGLLHRRCSPSEIRSEYSNSLGINFFAQAVSDRFQGVFCGAVLPHLRPLGSKRGARVDENNLPTGCR